MNYIDYHADDYGVSKYASERILELVEKQKLDSISIIANMSCYEECMQLLSDKWQTLPQKPLLCVHLNISNGLSLEDGRILSQSWGGLFIRSFLPGAKRNAVKKMLVCEYKKQIEKVYSFQKNLNDPEALYLRLDSHNHIHMIPLAFDAMLCAVSELGLENKLTNIRLSREPLFMFLFTKKVAFTYPLINLVKNMILNILSVRAKRILNVRNIPYTVLCGLALSGQTDHTRISILMPRLFAFSKKQKHPIEILRHPGRILENEVLPEKGSAADLEFLTSKNRDLEYEAALLNP